LPTMNATGKRRRRKRNLLRDYYGTLEENKEERQEPKKEEHRPLDIDHPSFDPQAYFEDLLQKQGVKQLISTDQEMRKEIKQLDSDMKTLVYENYNKFISATDTIRNMKKNVENMEEEMNSLEQNMEKISECTESINNTLAPRREKLKELNGVYRLLIKRQFLFELPSRLKKSIEMGSYNQAVSYYNKTHGVLQKYSDITSFASILKECEEIIAKLKEILSERAGDTELESPAIVESIGLLLDLNEPSTKLRKDYCQKHGAVVFWVLKGMKPKMDRFLQEKNARENKEEQCKAQDNEETNEGEELFFDFLSSVNNEFISTYLHFCGSYSNLFIKRESCKEEIEKANEEIIVFSQQVFDSYHSVLTNILLNMGQGTSVVVQGLSMIKTSMTVIETEFSNVVQVLRNAISDIINRTIQKLSNRAFKIMTKNIERHVIEVCESVSKKDDFVEDNYECSLSQLPNDLNHSLVDEIEIFIDKLKVLFMITPSTSFLSEYSGIFFTKLVVDVQTAILLITRFIPLLLGSGSESPEFKYSQRIKLPISTTPALILAKTCQNLAANSVAHLQDILLTIAVFPHQKTENKIDVPNLERELGILTKRLLSYYVRSQGQKISQMIRKGIETPNWLKVKEPRDVRPGMVIVVDDLKLMNKEVLKIFDKKKEVERYGNAGMRASRSRFDQGIAELFEKKIKIFGNVDPDPYSIMFAILKISLKSYFECVQLQTFSIHGYQQIQVDTSFMALVLRPIATKDLPMFERLIEEILNSGADRCLDPQAKMETSIVNSICQHKIKELQQKNSEMN